MSHLRTLWLDHHLTAFLWEVVICIWHEPPYVTHWVDISLPETERGIGGSPQSSVLCLNPWALLIFCRIYLVIRYIQVRARAVISQHPQNLEKETQKNLKKDSSGRTAAIFFASRIMQKLYFSTRPIIHRVSCERIHITIRD